MESSKTSSMEGSPQTTIHRLEMFLGRLSFYRSFIKDYSKLVYPFESLLRNRKDDMALVDKSKKFEVTPDVLDAFMELERAFFSIPVLNEVSDEQIYFVDSDLAVGEMMKSSEGAVG